MAIMTGRVTARIGSGRGGEVRAKKGRGRIPALSILARGACNITDYLNETNASQRGDWLYLVVYAIALASACVLRLDG